MNSMNDIKKLTCVIDRLEEEKAVLKFDDGQTLNISIEFLPDDVGEGSVIDVNFLGNEKGEEERGVSAKSLLNEILKKSE